MTADVELNTKGLDQLLRALGRPDVTVRIGILGDEDHGDGQSTAKIGAHHEFGAPKAHIPKRSFLREPLEDNLDRYLEEAGATDPEVLSEVLRTGEVLPVMRKVAAVGEQVVADAFDTGGFGKWAPLKSATLLRKKNHQILVETQQLRNSITSEVKGGE